jgi:hypothetical protein
MDFHCSYTTSFENGGKPFYVLKCRLQNRGMPLYNPSIALGFHGSYGGGYTTLSFRNQLDDLPDDKMFARGMIAEFYIKSYEMDWGYITSFSGLQDFEKQAPELLLYSQRYVCKRFGAGDWKDQVKGMWNKIALKWNLYNEYRVGTNPEGLPIMKTSWKLPYLAVLDFDLKNFIRWCLKTPT